ncbi:MAG TPA: SMP-30/gluconolactonase/LRE family protein [Candidatus Eisenbacteria bacterium]|nr:SMP-30/gluconolactonase/LRE family protein [Candidatus Eisenbacteria bacterium]
MRLRLMKNGCLAVAAIAMLASSPAVLSAAENPPSFVLKWGSLGSATGQFNEPRAVAYDANRGYVYVVERWNNRMQKFDESGRYISQVSLSSPQGVAVDGSGNCYVMDTGANRIKKFSPSGALLTQWGSAGTGNGQFSSPNGIAVDGSGNVYVADTWNYRIQKFTSSGTFVTKWGSQGTADNQFGFPRGVAADAQGNVYVVDTSGDRVQKFTTNGTFVTKWGSSGSGDGQFRGPFGIGADESGNVYVVDTSNHRIQKFSATGKFLTKWGTPGTGNGQFNLPMGIAARNGKIFVADTDNYRIQRFGAGASQIAVGDEMPTLEPRMLPVAPNPFTASTTVTFELPQAEDVHLRVFDVQGRLVASLEESYQPAGRHEATWNGLDMSGQRVKPGAYFIRLDAGRFRETRKVMLSP